MDLQTAANRRLKTQQLEIDYYTTVVWKNHEQYMNFFRNYCLTLHGFVHPITIDGCLNDLSILEDVLRMIPVFENL